MKVAAVMLTHRPDLAECARACFYRQTYRDKILVELDTRGRTESVGALRNEINDMARAQGADVIVHWDDDDWSHQLRIEFQAFQVVEIPKYQVTGYNSVPFWDERTQESWLYRSCDPKAIIGSSLCYGARLDLRFDDTSQGEDFSFVSRIPPRAVNAERAVDLFDEAPYLVARIHDRNTSTAYDRKTMQKAAEWARAPRFDDFCKGVFAR